MEQLHEKEGMEMDSSKKPKFCINDNMDVLIEILKRADGQSLGVAACVCRLWRGITRNDWLWEHLCFRHSSVPPLEAVRKTVVLLGGYKRLYMVCVRPVLSNRLFGKLQRRIRVERTGGGGGYDQTEFWRRQEIELYLSLFCIDYYERLLLGGSSGPGGGGSERIGGAGDSNPALSLMFLCEA